MSDPKESTVLLVDDEEIILHMLTEALRQAGHKVVACSHSADALAQFQDNPRDFDLVVTDQTMPGLNGIELLAELRKHREDLPAVVLSGIGSIISQENDEDERTIYLNKPGPLHELEESITKLLRLEK